MAEAGEVGDWSVLKTLNKSAGNQEIELVSGHCHPGAWLGGRDSLDAAHKPGESKRACSEASRAGAYPVAYRPRSRPADGLFCRRPLAWQRPRPRASSESSYAVQGLRAGQAAWPARSPGARGPVLSDFTTHWSGPSAERMRMRTSRSSDSGATKTVRKAAMSSP